jgi:ornithine--oxo-acid transaminase
MKNHSFDSLAALLESRTANRHQTYEQYVDPWKVLSVRRLQTDCDFTRAQGPYLYDDAGQRYLDFDAGNGVFAIGRNHPVACSIMHELLDLKSPNMVDREIPVLAGVLAETLAERVPGAAHRVLFASTGSEAVEAALKFTRKLTGRPRLLFLDGDYHGATYGAMSVTGVPFVSQGLGPMLPGCEGIPRNDLDRLERELSQGNVAGFIIEPIQGLEVRPLDPAYVVAAQRLCRQYGTALIVDEVFTGFGRTGRMFASEHFGIEADLLVVAKALSAGYVPVGGVIIRKDLYDKVFDRPGVFFTVPPSNSTILPWRPAWQL